MNLDKTASALKKINRLFEIISEIGEASTTEQDLLKAYINDMYSAVSEGENIPATAAKVATTTPVAPVVSAPAPVPIATAATPPEAPATEIAHEEPVVEMEPTPADEPAIASSDSVKSSSGPSSELIELFNLEIGSELSDRLSSTPVKDLTRAFAINEKIFTVNELFGGNNDEFANMLVALNGLDSFDEAKRVLINSVASKYEWQSEKKYKKAQNFIKIVQRRYN